MIFSSTTFLFLFLPIVLLLHFAHQALSWRNVLLLITSLLFYAWGEGFMVLVMIVSIGVNYSAGLAIGKSKTMPGRKRALIMALIFNLGLLALFKYANFLADNLNYLLDLMQLPLLYLRPIHLPIGISFFTFQAISYIVDVYWRKIPSQTNVFKLGLYIALFPQLIAGPIVRYLDIQKALDQRISRVEDISHGVQRFIIGLAKKVLIADTLGYVADQIFTAPAEALSMGTAWLGLLCYAFQIYYDFSGYSDMAIGLGRVFGFRFPENFNYPYLARSVREFWRRWHISLSTWFRDYVYIPLGGNRKSLARTYFNLGLVFFLCGLWHGASWNFIAWGLFHGLFLIVERTDFGKILKTIPRWIQHLYLMLVILISWVFFRADDLIHAFAYLKSLFGLAIEARYYAGIYLNTEIIFTLIVAILFMGPIYPFLAQKVRTSENLSLQSLQLITILVLLCWSLVSVISSTYHPFIYFRF